MKTVTLLITLFFCVNAFAQDGDTDDDGVLDSQDLCPTVKGTLKNKGCPEEGDKKTIKPDNVPVTTTLFNTKLFEEQVISIIANPTNKFANIMGEEKVGVNNYALHYKSTVGVEGIGNADITIYDNKKLVFKAENVKSLNEREAGEIIAVIDKQLQAVKFPFPYTRKVEYMGTFITYDFDGKMATIELSMATYNDAKDAFNWNVTFRVNKKK